MNVFDVISWRATLVFVGLYAFGSACILSEDNSVTRFLPLSFNGRTTFSHVPSSRVRELKTASHIFSARSQTSQTTAKHNYWCSSLPRHTEYNDQARFSPYLHHLIPLALAPRWCLFQSVRLTYFSHCQISMAGVIHPCELARRFITTMSHNERWQVRFG